MVMVNKFGLMVLSMMESGNRTRLSDRENWFMQMEIFMRDSGKTIKLMVRAVTSMQMGLLM